MCRCLLILLGVFLFACPVWVEAYDAQASPAAETDDEDTEAKNIASIQEDAAVYRLARDGFVTDAAYEARAAEYLTQAQAILADGSAQPLEGWYYFLFSNTGRASRLAMRGFARRPYSAVAGELIVTAIRAYARAGDISDVYRHLVMLWYYLPDYPHLQEVMETAQAAAERVQNFEATVNLEAENPGDVINIDANGTAAEVVRLYRFQALHGDRETVAPRAVLGLARALMTMKANRDMWVARREYEHFLDLYPSHPLTFNALCEQALCYLLTYQGSDYDVGVLFSAESVIRQAEIEARNDPAKLRKVEAYRRRIRLWRQDRDLAVARWYADRVPPTLAFIQRPGFGPDSWNRSAHYYFREVIKADNASPQGLAAARELDRLPPEPPDVLGKLTP